MTKRVLVAADKLAEYSIERGFDNAMDAVEGFAATLLDGFYDGNPDIAFGYDDEMILECMLREFVEEALVEEANILIEEWNQEAREEIYEREEARRGMY